MRPSESDEGEKLETTQESSLEFNFNLDSKNSDKLRENLPLKSETMELIENLNSEPQSDPKTPKVIDLTEWTNSSTKPSETRRKSSLTARRIPAKLKEADPISETYKPSTYKPPTVSETKTSTKLNNPMSTTPIIDYRKNVERQVREQKTTGSILGVIAYTFIGFVCVAIALASYGAYVIFGELNAQKVTTAQMRAELIQQIEALQKELQDTRGALAQIQQDNNRALTVLQNRVDTLQAGVNTEKKTRETETRDLKTRLSRIERAPLSR